MENDRLRDPTALNRHIAERTPDQGTCHVFLDEIQEVDHWERVVNSLVAHGGYDIYLTGSSSRLLSSELATYIAGRHVAFEMPTLSYSEYVVFARETNTEDADLFTRYLTRSGFPGLFAAAYSDADARLIVSDIYASVVVRDVIKRNAIRSPEAFERIARFVFDAQPATPRNQPSRAGSRPGCRRADAGRRSGASPGWRCAGCGRRRPRRH